MKVKDFKLKLNSSFLFDLRFLPNAHVRVTEQGLKASVVAKTKLKLRTDIPSILILQLDSCLPVFA